MLDKEKPDTVFVCTADWEHLDPCLEVIERDSHLFVEKPFVFKINEANNLLKEAKKRKLFFGINFNWHYSTPVKKAAEAIKKKQIRRYKLYNMAFWRAGWR